MFSEIEVMETNCEPQWALKLLSFFAAPTFEYNYSFLNYYNDWNNHFWKLSTNVTAIKFP